MISDNLRELISKANDIWQKKWEDQMISDKLDQPQMISDRQLEH